MSEICVFSRFQVTKTDGNNVKLRIQEARPKDMNKVLEFILKHFVYEEKVFITAAGVPNTEDSLNEFRFLMNEVLENPNNSCLICVIDEGDSDDVTVVGSNVLYFNEAKNEPNPKPNTPEIRKMLELMHVATQTYNVLEQQGVAASFAGAGLSVDPNFRRCGIAIKLLEARKPFLLKRKVAVTDAWFTSVGSQKAAKHAGYKEVAEISLKEFGKQCNVVFDANTPPTIKFMILKV